MIEKKSNGSNVSFINIQGKFSGSSLMKNISNLNNQVNVLHIILSDHSNFSFSLFLFQLVVLKVINNQGIQYQRVPKTLKKIYVEISNTIGEKIFRSIDSTLKTFEHKKLNFEEQFYQLEIPNEIGSDIQFVCNYLAYFDSEKLATTPIYFTDEVEGLTLTVFDELSQEDCLKLLKKYFWDVKKQNKEEISMNLLIIFIRVFSQQLDKYSNSLLLDENSILCEELDKKLIRQVRIIYFEALYNFALKSAQRAITEGNFFSSFFFKVSFYFFVYFFFVSKQIS